MRILFLTSRLPYPPHRGDKLRTFNFLRVLSAEHEIHIVSFYESRNELAHLDELKKYCERVDLVYLPKWLSWLRVCVGLFSKLPAQAQFYESRRMRRLLKSIVRTENIDCAYFHLFRMYQYYDLLPKNIYKVVDLTDVISKEIYRSVGLKSRWRVAHILREANKIRRLERQITEAAQEVWVISDTEKNDFQATTRCNNIRVVTNGVDVKADIHNPESKAVLFFGYSNTGHNRHALNFLRNKIMPEISREIPGIKLNIFGAGKRAGNKKSNGEFPVINFGFIESMEEVFSLSTVLVAPILYSAGTQNKIIDAMNSAIPVITSFFGNEGIGGTHGENILICSAAGEYVEAIKRVLMDKEFAARLGINGQKFVRQKFSWTNVTDRANGIEKTLKSQNLKS